MWCRVLGRMCRWLALNNGCHTLVTTHGCLHRRVCSEVTLIFQVESKFEYFECYDNDCQVTIIIAQKCTECSAGQDRLWRWRWCTRHVTPITAGAGARVSAVSGHTLATPPPSSTSWPGLVCHLLLLLGTPSHYSDLQ